MDGVANSVSSPETTSNPPKSHETVSVFGESSCGEPLFAQHICINFTPTEPDNHHLMINKCVSFWNFINNNPEIRDLLVLSEPNKYTTVEDSKDMIEVSSDKSMEVSETVTESRTPPVDRTAVSVLELIEGKGLIDRTFEAKMAQTSWCSIGDKEYGEDNISPPPKPAPMKSSAALSYLKKVSNEGSPIESTYARNVCKKMENWDSQHLKSMDPPGHPPALHHSVMQRTPR